MISQRGLGGGAIVFELLIGAPIAIGAGLGVYLIRFKGQAEARLLKGN